MGGGDQTGDPEHITPALWRAYVAERQGLPIDRLIVPPIVIGTFQPPVYARMRERTGADTYEGAPLGPTTIARGEFGEQQLLAALFPVGAPAAAILAEELIACGARRFLFVGSAGSLQRSLPIGALAIADSARREEGTSGHYLPPDAVPHASPMLVEALRVAARVRGQELPVGPVWTTDAIYRELSSKVRRYAAQGVLAVEMEAAAMFAIAAFRGVEAALIVAMSDELFHPWNPGFHATEYERGIYEALEIALDAATTLRDSTPTIKIP